MVQHHLEELGHKIVRNRDKDYDVILCWGCSTRDLGRIRTPALNGQVNLYNKYEALRRFKRVGLTIPTTFSVLDGLDNITEYDLPWYARRVHHEKGQDIICCENPRAVTEVVKNRTADFFSVYIPHTEEIRAWVFKGRAIAFYHKHYKNPGLYNFRNRENSSELREDLLGDRSLIATAVQAVNAMEMDFGAVDILRGKNGKDYVLEVNSTPDISSLVRISGIRLAKQISKWAEAQ